MHNSIQFTFEAKSNNRLPFLDVNVLRINDQFMTTVFRKATFTGFGINYFSFILHRYKLASIRTLLFRGFRISSAYESFHKEVEFLQSHYTNNSFPSRCFNSGCFYQQVHQNLFQKYILRYLKKYDNPDVLPRSPLIYKYTYKCSKHTSSNYRRTSQHKGVLFHTGSPPIKPGNSSIRNCNSNNKPFDQNKCTVLDYCHNSTDLHILKTMYINIELPILISNQSNTTHYIL